MPKGKQEIVDAVIEKLKLDFEVSDYTVLDELLSLIPKAELICSLPEEDWVNFK